MDKVKAPMRLPQVTILLGVSAVALIPFWACRNGSADPASASTAARSRSAAVPREIATGERLAALTEATCLAHLRQRGIARATHPAGSAKLAGAEAREWKRPATIRCELCGTPIRDGDKLVGRIAVINAGGAPADVFLQSASHGPFWLETVPPAPPPPPTGTPRPEVYPAPILWTIPARSALDAEVQADVSEEVLQKGGSIRVRASVVFWNGSGLDLCDETSVAL